MFDLNNFLPEQFKRAINGYENTFIKSNGSLSAKIRQFMLSIA